MKEMSRIVTDVVDYSNLIKDLWESNTQLSKYQYPVLVYPQTQKHLIHFLCSARDQGCKFYIRFKLKTAKIKEPCQSIQAAMERAKLINNFDIKNFDKDQISYYKSTYFKNQHTHNTMIKRLKHIQIIKQANSSNNTMKSLNLANKINYCKRKGQEELKKSGGYLNNDDIDNDTKRKVQQKQRNIIQQITQQIKMIKGQRDKKKKDAQDFKQQIFGQNAIFISQSLKNFSTSSKQQKNGQEKISRDNKNQNKQSNKSCLLQKNGNQLQQTIKDQPCFYFYSSNSMQKNLTSYNQTVNIIQIQPYQLQQLKLQSQKQNLQKKYIYIFSSTTSDKQCAIFAMALLCNGKNLYKMKQFMIDQFFNVPKANKVETVIIPHQDWDLLKIIQNKSKKYNPQKKIKCIMRIPFCLQAQNKNRQSSLYYDLIHYKVKYQRFYEFYKEGTHFVAMFAKSLFQLFQRDADNHNQYYKSYEDQQNEFNLSQDRVLSHLYMQMVLKIQSLLIKMSLVLDAQNFGKYLCELINNFCFNDEQIKLIQFYLLKYRDKLFISQMEERFFIGLNLFVDMKSCADKYFLLKQKVYSNQKLFKSLIIRGNQTNSKFNIVNKYWLNYGEDINLNEDLDSTQFLQQSETGFKQRGQVKNFAKDPKQCKKSAYFYEIEQNDKIAKNDTQKYLLEKYRILKVLQKDSYRVGINEKDRKQQKQRKQKKQIIMKKLPFYNQSTLYLSQNVRQLIFNVETMNMLKYSWIDFSDRIVFGSMGQSNMDVFYLAWTQNQTQIVQRLKQNKGLWKCSCKFPEFLRMPCRHILKAMIKYECNMVTSVDQFWHKK